MPEEPEVNINETIDRVWGLVARRWQWVLGIGFGVTLATSAVLIALPNSYTSEATLIVVQQQVPERYVAPNSTTDVISALQAMKREVLSRTRMLKLVEDFNLYEKQRKRLAPEELAEKVLHDIDIQPLDDGPEKKGSVSAFKISFAANNPALAQRVNSRLTSLFIDQSLKTREEQAVSTTAFLHDQLDQKRQALEAEDKKLRDLKEQFIGELPEQQPGNLGILASLQAQLQNAGASLSHAQEQRAYLQSLLNGYVAQATADLNQLRAKRAKLLETYTPQYPAVLELDEEITQADSALQHLLQPGAGVSAKTSGTAAVANGSEQLAAAQIKSQLDANSLEVANLSAQETRLNNQIAEYQKRLNETPAREQQLLSVTRDAEQLRLEYADLGKKEQESQLATNLEKNQGGQQFRLADPPSLPAIPSSPKRLKISLGGIAAGFGLGLALAVFLEMKDRSLHSEGEACRRLAAPVVIALPLLLTPNEERTRARKRALEWATASVMAVAVCIAELLVYRKG
jgi:polysaccharide biosynthesis transport protein